MAVRQNKNVSYLDAERIKRRGDKPMEGPEVLDEFEFLISAGTHPLLAAQMLGMKYATLGKLAGRHNRQELLSLFDIGEWDRYKHDNNQYGRAA
ncbi:hypothetical protein [Microbacterium paludicola]|uniref:hypothetical protein n=1 Tax=Microbacterium paludicola TaxID=300019 RepID=UPI0011A5E49B|nr:hypothetical protein [Microbacterium paludicola]